MKEREAGRQSLIGSTGEEEEGGRETKTRLGNTLVQRREGGKVYMYALMSGKGKVGSSSKPPQCLACIQVCQHQ